MKAIRKNGEAYEVVVREGFCYVVVSEKEYYGMVEQKGAEVVIHLYDALKAGAIVVPGLKTTQFSDVVVALDEDPRPLMKQQAEELEKAERIEKESRGLKFAVSFSNYDDWDRQTDVSLVRVFPATIEEVEKSAYKEEYKKNLHLFFDEVCPNVRECIPAEYAFETAFNGGTKYNIISSETANIIIENKKKEQAAAEEKKREAEKAEKEREAEKEEKEREAMEKELLYFGLKNISNTERVLIHSLGASENEKTISIYSTVHCQELKAKSTYDLKDELKARGFAWNAAKKQWEVKTTDENREIALEFLRKHDKKGSPAKFDMVECQECGRWVKRSKCREDGGGYYCGC